MSNERFRCSKCPAKLTTVAKPAIIRLSDDGYTWSFQPENTPVHLAALFRDPGIDDKRSVHTVLDLHAKNGHVIAGKNCWVDAFLEAITDLPNGLTVALDNGVRCPCPIKNDQKRDKYFERLILCNEYTTSWYNSLKHPNGGVPGIVLCDKDLTYSLARLGLIKQRNGEDWKVPSRFIDVVGEEVLYLETEALILAHPIVVKRSRKYYDIFKAKGIKDKICKLAQTFDIQTEYEI